MAKMNAEKFREWVAKTGNANAKQLLIDRIGYSESTAEKMVAGSYGGRPFKLQRNALCELTGMSMDELFPIAEDNGDEPPPGGRAA